MKTLTKFILLTLLCISVVSCSSVRVMSDYDTDTNFNNYKTFAFYKAGIDKAEISDLDKRRILRAIESELLTKGLKKSESPDLLVSIFTKSRENVNVFNNSWNTFGWGWGWGPWYWNNFNTVSRSTEGVLYIDFIDAQKNELIWQGIGTGYLTQDPEEKNNRIKIFVAQILEQYPPNKG